MSTNFPILIETEESAVGSVLRVLHKTPGVVGIHLQLEAAATAGAAGVRQLTPPKEKLQKPPKKLPARNLNGERGGIRKTIGMALLKAPLHWNILKQIVERAGFSDASTRSAITKMTIDKEIVRIAPGTYRITAKGQKKYEAGERLHPLGTKDGKLGLRPLILKEMVKRGNSIEHVDLKNFLVEEGYSDANIYNMVPKMRTEGLVTRHGDTYSMTDQGHRFLAKLREGTEVVEKPTPALEDRSQEGFYEAPEATDEENIG